MKATLLLIGLFLFGRFATGQTLPIVEKDGQKYYAYTTLEGQSISEIQALLHTDIDQLLALNPGLERGIDPQQVIVFPVRLGTITHQVAPQQTLYAISRLYEVAIDSLLNWNPSAVNGLKIGQAIRIHHAVIPFDLTNPQPQGFSTAGSAHFAHKLSDTIIKHTVLEKETLYAISKRYMVPVDSLLLLNKMSSYKVTPGQKLLVPIQKEKSSKVPSQAIPEAQKWSSSAPFDFPVPKKQQYEIAVFLPFQLDSSAVNNRFVAAAALDYYMGMKLAFDSLKKIGLVANVHVYDDNAVSPGLSKILEGPEMKKMDLIFSPLQEKPAQAVASFAKAQGIPIVFPVQMPTAIVQMAPNFIAYTAPEEAHVQTLTAHLHAQYKGCTIVLINSPIAADQQLEQDFKKAFMGVSTAVSKLKLQEASWTNYQKFKTVGGAQVLVSFSSDRAKVAGLLKAAALDSNLIIVGQKDWLDFKELDDPEVRDQTFLVSLPSYFNYHAPQVIKFHKNFRRSYNTDLTKMACLGFDVTLHIGKQLVGNYPIQNGLISNMSLRYSPNQYYIENAAAVVVPYKNAQLIAPNHE
jgi:LysM repeat protein